MPLTTRCSRCGRLFPVYAQQLRTVGGRVNCPQCGHRFNGRVALIDEPMLDSTPAQGRTRLGLGRQQTSSARLRPRPPAGRQGRRSAQSPEPPPVTLPAPASRRRPGPIGRLVRATAVLALFLALAAQLLWWNRERLLQDPDLRRVADILCQRIGCTVPVVRIEGALEVLEPSLTEDPEAGSMKLALQIRNTTEIPQPRPLLDLELLDPQGEPVATRRFTPEEYGAGEQQRLVDPEETVAVSLEMAAIRHPTSGFRVRLP